MKPESPAFYAWGAAQLSITSDRELSVASYPNTADGPCPRPTDEPGFQVAYYVGRHAVELPDRILRGIIPDEKLEDNHTFLDYLSLDQISEIYRRLKGGGYAT